jgi:hypothetical protein
MRWPSLDRGQVYTCRYRPFLQVAISPLHCEDSPQSMMLAIKYGTFRSKVRSSHAVGAECGKYEQVLVAMGLLAGYDFRLVPTPSAPLISEFGWIPPRSEQTLSQSRLPQRPRDNTLVSREVKNQKRGISRNGPPLALAHI